MPDRFKFNKRAELFVGVNNKAPSVAAMRVCNPDCLPVGIQADTQPQLQPALLRLSAMTSQNFTLIGLCRFCSPHSNDKVI